MFVQERHVHLHGAQRCDVVQKKKDQTNVWSKGFILGVFKPSKHCELQINIVFGPISLLRLKVDGLLDVLISTCCHYCDLKKKLALGELVECVFQKIKRFLRHSLSDQLRYCRELRLSKDILGEPFSRAQPLVRLQDLTEHLG